MPAATDPRRLSLVSAAPDRAEELFTEHSRRIYAYCLRQLGSPEEAEDAMQATYLNACRSLLSGFEPEVAQAWLYKVAQNVCLTKQRSSWRRRRVERPEDIQEIQDYIPAPESGDELFGIGEALAGLPEQQRRAILLREWKGLSYREVAEEMELSQGAVETLIFRARRSLAAALDEPEEPTRRARLMHSLDAGALLAGLKTALSGSLATSLATGIAVAASTTAIVASPIGRVDHRAPTGAPSISSTENSERPALADRDARAYRVDSSAEARGNGKSNALAKGKDHRQGKPVFASQNAGSKPSNAASKPSWAGTNVPPPQANIGGQGKANASPKARGEPSSVSGFL
jgi:RNA polymerase sigma-70 factor, ECF subfamily